MMMPLAIFYGGTILSISFYGGLFSVLPAYIADIFGQKHVGAIHGRVLTAWSTAALLGPMILTTLRRAAHEDALQSLVAKCDPGAFQRAFGAPVDQLSQLVSAKTVTINRSELLKNISNLQSNGRKFLFFFVKFCNF
jgi:hypothetical protein